MALPNHWVEVPSKGTSEETIASAIAVVPSLCGDSGDQMSR